jgi:hypothetical protein
VTGPVMLLVIKLTSLAFNLSDADAAPKLKQVNQRVVGGGGIRVCRARFQHYTAGGTARQAIEDAGKEGAKPSAKSLARLYAGRLERAVHGLPNPLEFTG